MRETKKIFKINLTLLFVIFFNFQIFPNISNGVEPEEMLADKKMELEHASKHYVPLGYPKSKGK